MATFGKIVLALGIGGLLMVLVVGGMYVNYNNQDVSLRNRAKAEEDLRRGVHDKMWKILKDKAGVTDQYAEKFGQIYKDLIEGRYSNGGGEFAKFITESNPNFDNGLYKDLMVSIEAQRTEFFNSQKKLRDIKTQHDDLLGRMPSSWFVSNKTPIEVVIITSTSTEKVFESGRDDESLFQK